MVVNMLKAVSEMLNFSIPTKMEQAVLEVRVACARTMLNEIIKGLEDKPLPMAGLRVPDKHPTPETKPEIPPTKEEPQYMISVDDKKQLKMIKNLPLDAEVIVDGKTMLHRDAIGMKFQKIKVMV